MDIDRRQFFRSIGAAILSVAVHSLFPERLLAAWDEKSAIASRFGTMRVENSSAIQIQTPENAENGGYIPVGVTTTIPEASNITIFSNANPVPLIASFDIFPRMLPDVSIRLRIKKTTTLVVLVHANNTLYRATKEVTIKAGGCNG